MDTPGNRGTWSAIDATLEQLMKTVEAMDEQQNPPQQTQVQQSPQQQPSQPQQKTATSPVKTANPAQTPKKATGPPAQPNPNPQPNNAPTKQPVKQAPMQQQQAPQKGSGRTLPSPKQANPPAKVPQKQAVPVQQQLQTVAETSEEHEDAIIVEDISPSPSASPSPSPSPSPTPYNKVPPTQQNQPQRPQPAQKQATAAPTAQKPLRPERTSAIKSPSAEAVNTGRSLSAEPQRPESNNNGRAVSVEPQRPITNTNTSEKRESTIIPLSLEEQRKELENRMRKKAGQLHKNVGKNKWEPRFFVTNAKEHELAFYTDNTLSKLKGVIALTNSMVELIEGTVEGRDFCIKVKAPKNEYLVSADNKKEQLEWVCALQIGINGVISLPNSQIESIFKTQVIEDNSTRLIACAGWVEKKSKKNGKNTSWKKRYLVLSDARHTNTKSMIYFESDSNGGSKKKGEINLMGASIEKVKDTTGKKRNCFIIHTVRDEKPIDFDLATETFEECDKWIVAVSEAAKILRERSRGEKIVEGKTGMTFYTQQ